MSLGLDEEWPSISIEHFVSIMQCSLPSISMHHINFPLEMLAVKTCYYKNKETYGGGETIWTLLTEATRQYALIILIEFPAVRSMNFYDQSRVD